jgi:hypothetical protein
MLQASRVPSTVFVVTTQAACLAAAIAALAEPAECPPFSAAVTLLEFHQRVEAVADLPVVADLAAVDLAAVATVAPEVLAVTAAEVAEGPPAPALAIGVEAAAAVCMDPST